MHGLFNEVEFYFVDDNLNLIALGFRSLHLLQDQSNQIANFLFLLLVEK